MLYLAYIDVRPVLYLGGLALALVLGLLFSVVVLGGARRGRVAAGATAIWTALFTLFLTEYGPFVGQVEVVEHRLTWEVGPLEPGSMAVVEFSFVDHPGRYLWQESAELAAHLEDLGEPTVVGRFRVTRDYGRTRGYALVEVAGLAGWASKRGAGGTKGNPASSPWD
jgi:hypothetical protein